mmetsp:Transcript_10968/g.21282  ORF Transcript_10968/g.21282 Transcript_10968/m.21282 type:complete len:91 (+) Transcript_10968:2-274(+)
MDTKGLLLAIINTTESNKTTKQTSEESVYEYAREKAAAMPDMSERHRQLRLQRRARREPHITAFGFPVRYEETPPEWMVRDGWEGLKTIA